MASLFARILGMFSSDVGIDLGTANTLIFMKNKGIVLDEPSIISMVRSRSGRQQVLEVGRNAKLMLGRTPANITTIRPLRQGVIADFEMAGEMMKQFIRKVHDRRTFISPRIAVCIPSGATQVERRAIRESAESAGAREVYLVEEPMAAAIGGGLPVTDANGSMVVDIGGGTTEVGIISLGGLVTTRSIRVGGDAMDEALMNYIRSNFNLQLGEQSAEQIKMTIGSAIEPEDDKDEGQVRKIRGMDVITGIPREVTMTERHTATALAESVQAIVEAVRQALAATKPEVAADIVDCGILLTGGGALLKGLDMVIRDATKLPVTVHEQPLHCVVYGTGQVLNNENLLSRLIEEGSV